MLEQIELRQFKCFDTLHLPLRRLTLLSGTNATGKSTVLQALTLLHQSVLDTSLGPHLLLDGSVLSLGTVGDVVDKVNGRRSFAIGLRGPGFTCSWLFQSAEARRDIAVPAVALRWSDDDAPALEPKERDFERGDAIPSLIPTHLRARRRGAALAGLLSDLTYISAERVGPREVYPLRDPRAHRSVGHRGELAPGMLHWFPEHPIAPSLCRPEESVPMLFKQSLAWLAEFFPGASFDVQRVPGANLVTLGVRTSPDTDFHRPQHVGFGLTHVLPILIACLHAPLDAAGAARDAVIIIENPEVHLHPMGQARMGQFLACAAAAGVQLLVETHSDHVLNGVRRAVRDGLLRPEDLALHFFLPRAQAEADGRAQVLSPQMDAGGNIDHWPQGFFDQYERDLGYLAGLDG